MHRSLKAGLRCGNIYATLEEQQVWFNHYRHEFNHERHHDARSQTRLSPDKTAFICHFISLRR